MSRFASNWDSFPLLRIEPPFRREVWHRPNGGTPGYRAIAEHPSDFIAMMNNPERRVQPPK